MVAEDHPVREVLKNIVASSTINAEQVRELESFVRQDWVIDETEGKFLFRLNHALGEDFEGCPEWTHFFVTSITRMVVLDMNTPGQIDEAEGDWLGEMLDEFSVANESEQKLLAEIQKTTTAIVGKIGQRIQPVDTTGI